MELSNLYIVCITYANDENDEAQGGHPYAIYAETKEDAIEKAKKVALNLEIEGEHETNQRLDPEGNYIPKGYYENYNYDLNDPESSKFTPITWDSGLGFPRKCN